MFDTNSQMVSDLFRWKWPHSHSYFSHSQ